MSHVRSVLSLLFFASLLACAGEDPAPEVEGGEAGSSGTGGTGEPSTPGRGGPPEVGAACIPPSEDSPDYPGGMLDRVALEATENCASGLCLLHHFQGRVTCPYGQNVDALELAADDPARCRLPFQDGASEDDAVAVAVPPQFTGRTAAQVVHCSCRCDGPDPSLEYCACPEGMACAPLVDDDSPYAGSYCIKEGTEYDATASYGAPCGAGAPDEAELCGEANP